MLDKAVPVCSFFFLHVCRKSKTKPLNSCELLFYGYRKECKLFSSWNLLAFAVVFSTFVEVIYCFSKSHRASLSKQNVYRS